MANPDELLDAAAEVAHRKDMRRTAIISAVSLSLVLVTSVLIVVGGIPA